MRQVCLSEEIPTTEYSGQHVSSSSVLNESPTHHGFECPGFGDSCACGRVGYPVEEVPSPRITDGVAKGLILAVEELKD